MTPAESAQLAKDLAPVVDAMFFAACMGSLAATLFVEALYFGLDQLRALLGRLPRPDRQDEQP